MKRTILASLAAAVTTTVFAAPTDTDNALVKDTTKVIDIEEVVVIATPKENNRLRQQAISSTSLSQNEMRNNSVTSVKALSGLVPNLFIPDYGSKLTTEVDNFGICTRYRFAHQYPSRRSVCRQYPIHRQVGIRLQLL